MKLKHTIIGMAAGAAMVPTANAVNQYTGTVINAMEELGATVELACKKRHTKKTAVHQPIEETLQPLEQLVEQLKKSEGQAVACKKRHTKKTA